MGGEHGDPEIGRGTAVFVYYSYAVLILFGHIRDFFGRITGMSRYMEVKPKKGYSVLLKSWENFFTRRLYHRIQDCWGRPICSSPGVHIDVMERKSDDNNASLYVTGKSKRCVNVGSYNYLGFADDWHSTCADQVLDAVDKWPVSLCNSRMDFGNSVYHEELEAQVEDLKQQVSEKGV